jgi:hypothetical protein
MALSFGATLISEHAMARSTRKSTGKRKSTKTEDGKLKKLAASLVALAATAVLKQVAQKVATDPKIQRKAMELAKAAGKRTRAAGKKVRRAARSGK